MRSREGAWALAVVTGAATVTFVATLVLGRLGVDPHHDGLIFKAARDVLDGQMPYRDSYNQYGPLLPLLQALFLAVLGPTVLALKASAAVFYAVSAVLLILVWRRIVGLGIALGAWFVWLAAQPEITTHLEMLPWSSVYALATSTGAVFAMLKAFEGRRLPIWAVGSGVLIGATVMLRFPVGLTVFAGILVGLACWMPRPAMAVIRAAGWFLSGVVASVAAVLVWLGFSGALPAFWTQTIIEPRDWSRIHQDGSLALIRDTLFRAIPTTLFGFAIVALFGLIVARLTESPVARGRHVGLAAWVAGTVIIWVTAWDQVAVWVTWSSVQMAAAITTLALALAFIGLGVARLAAMSPLANDSRWSPPRATTAIPFVTLAAASSLPQFYPIFESRHIYWAAALSLGVLAWALHRAIGRRALALLLLAVTFLTPALWGSIRGADARSDAFSVHPAAHFAALDGILVTPAFNERYGAMMKALRRAYDRAPGAPMMNMGPDGLWLALGDRMDNPDRYFLSWPALGDPAARARFIYREKPIIWFEHPAATFPVRDYADALGYRVAHHESPVAEGDWDYWLLTPTPHVRTPPYRWRPEWGPIVGPAMMWATP